MSQEERVILDLVHRMLRAIHAGDTNTYEAMCDPHLTCFEADVAPYRIDGLPFHVALMQAMSRSHLYADLVRFDVLDPSVQMLSDEVAVATYTRLMTYVGAAGTRWVASNETRVFRRSPDGWRMVHFHRSPAATGLRPAS